MKTHFQKLTLFSILALFGALSPIQAGEPTCGGHNQRACGLGDPEFYNMGFLTCEQDLKPQNGICVNQNRYNLPPNTQWLGWAMRNQIRGIGGNTPFNFLTQLASHNAYASVLQGFANSLADQLLTNQYFTITDQLNAGIRVFEIDVHWYQDELVVCHNGADDCLPTSKQRYFSHVLREFRIWMDANPDEIIIMKLDDHINTHEPDLINAINVHFTGQVFLRNGSNTWPTPNQVRAAGKRILFYLRNGNASSGLLFRGKSPYVTSSDHPQDFDFNQCKDGDFQFTYNRAADRFSALAEGRSGGNLFDLTGLIYENQVGFATKCQVSSIGLDYILALDKPNTAAFARSSPPDGRLSASIWSWAPLDYGTNPPLLRASTGHWHSTNPAQVNRYACATDFNKPYFNDRRWRITQQAGPWSQGDAFCKSQFGTGYYFAFPQNGFQNEELRAAAQSTDVWLAYNPAGINFSDIAIVPSALALRYAPGSPLPAPVSIDVYAPVGTLLFAKTGANWLTVNAPNTQSVPAGGKIPFSISLTNDVTNLAPGSHTSEIAIQNQNEQSKVTRIPVTLQVLSNATITISADLNPSPQGNNNRFVVRVDRVGAPQFVGGTVTLKEIVPGSNGAPNTLATLLTQTQSNTPADLLKPEVLLSLDPGVHRLVATYDGGDRHVPVSSAELLYTVIARIQATPNPIQFQVIKGAALPPSQNIAVTGANNTLTYTLNFADWATKSNESLNGLTLGLNSEASTRPLGQYNGTLRIKDSISTTDVPMVLNVRAALQVSKTQSTILTSGGPGSDAIQVLNSDNIALSVTSNQPWLSAQLSRTTSPATIQIAVDGAALNLGQTYTGTITLSSPQAVQPLQLSVVVQSVRPTLFGTDHPGLVLTIDGQSVLVPASYVWAPDSVHTVSAPSTQGNASKRFRFLNWKDNGAQNRSITASLNGGSYTANYQVEYPLSTNASTLTGGSLAINPPSADGFYAENTLVTLTATPASGKVFNGYTGTVNFATANISNPVLQVLMTQAQTINASFRDQTAIQFSITSNLAGAVALVDGVSTPLPAIFSWLPGSTHRLSVPTPLAQGPASRLVFASWSNNNPNSHQIATPSTNGSLQLNLTQEHQVNLAASPLSGGTTSGSGWYAAGANALLSATANAGFAFSGFSGSLSSPANPFTAPVNGPLNLIANFTPTGKPILYASTMAARSDGPTPDSRIVPIHLTNAGVGLAGDVRITGITNVTVVAGTGNVFANSALPALLGNLQQNQSASASIGFNWPATATRVRMTVQFSANGGTYTGSTVLTLTR
jgi:hypothetical protein